MAKIKGAGALATNARQVPTIPALIEQALKDLKEDLEDIKTALEELKNEFMNLKK